MRRRIIQFAMGLLLTLSVAAIALWVRSYFASDHLSVALPKGYVSIESDSGGIEFRRPLWTALCSEWWEVRYEKSDPWPRDWNIFFIDDIRTTRPGYHGWTFGITHWLLALILGLPPVIFFSFKRDDSSSTLLCPKCSYDMRATPDAAVTDNFALAAYFIHDRAEGFKCPSVS